MASLPEYLMRKLAAHAYRFAFLPLTSVPSAAVSDDDTQAWSAESYDRDLDDEKPKPAADGGVA